MDGWMDGWMAARRERGKMSQDRQAVGENVFLKERNTER